MANAQATKEARASVKYVHMSANKARFVLDQVRGKSLDEARRILLFSQRGASHDISKVLEAAVANAENTFNMDADLLYVSRCWADEGPTQKRWMPRAQGRAYRIRKRMTHITICVQERESKKR